MTMKCLNLKPSLANTLQAGFTLLEVLIALSIIAIAFTSLFSSQSSSLSLAIQAEFQTKASLLAREVIAGYESGLVDFAVTGSDFEEEFQHISWEAEISEVLEGEIDLEDLGEMQLYRIDLKIVQDDNDQIAEFTWYQYEHTNDDA